MSWTSIGKKTEGIKILIGLGNPGVEYENTYHNIGVKAIFDISGKNQSDFHRVGGKPFHYLKDDGRIFVVPETYMNESGAAIKAALDYFNAGIEDLILLHDDSDIEAGKYKISKERGSAGHKGIRSAIETLGTNDFTRVRIGIRGKAAETGGERKKANEFVLKKLTKDDSAAIKEAFGKIKEELI